MSQMSAELSSLFSVELPVADSTSSAHTAVLLAAVKLRRAKEATFVASVCEDFKMLLNACKTLSAFLFSEVIQSDEDTAILRHQVRLMTELEAPDPLTMDGYSASSWAALKPISELQQECFAAVDSVNQRLGQELANQQQSLKRLSVHLSDLEALYNDTLEVDFQGQQPRRSLVSPED